MDANSQDLAKTWNEVLEGMNGSPEPSESSTDFSSPPPHIGSSFSNDESGLSRRDRGYLGTVKLEGIAGDTAVLSVPNEVVRQALEGGLREPVTAALNKHLGQPMRIAVIVESSQPPRQDRTQVREISPDADPSIGRADGQQLGLVLTADEDITEEKKLEEAKKKKDGEAILSPLNKQYTFESFVVGQSNRFPHSAAISVADFPGESYNPLYIYGGSGLGKTHLMHAIGNQVRLIYPQLKVLYVSSEEFTNDFINSIRIGRIHHFQKRYRSVDVLLIDDVQFFQGKEQTQEEFFHTFNVLHSAKKQIVLTSDHLPKQLNDIADRLRSRFEWGLQTDLQFPDFETRQAILQKKSDFENMGVDGEVIEIIANTVTSNVRELEGALIRVTAYAQLSRQPLTPELATIALGGMSAHNTTNEVSVGHIMQHTADFFNVTIEDLESNSRSRHLVHARQVAMYLCRELTSLSLPRIGQAFGGRDHTTVMYAVRKIRQRLREDRGTFDQVQELTKKLRANL